jgi:spoIIIJ-associated protein
MKIEADTLQEAFSKAATELSCSVTKLDIKVIQHPRAGLFGMFKKPAIIEAYREGEARTKPAHEPKAPAKEEQKTAPDAACEPKETKELNERKPRQRKPRQRRKKDPEAQESLAPQETTSMSSEPLVAELHPLDTKTPEARVRSVPQQPKQPREHAVLVDVLPEIDKGVRELVGNSCFTIEVVKVEPHDDQTVLIEINGEDAALLIGKEGYRYKAFSYLLYNWINMKYGLGIRLEIAQFLHNQEEMIENYLLPVVERIQAQGRGQTKPLDGVLIKIALEKLRARFPEKYVGIKTGREGRKFVVVNDFNRKTS